MSFHFKQTSPLSPILLSSVIMFSNVFTFSGCSASLTTSSAYVFELFLLKIPVSTHSLTGSITITNTIATILFNVSLFITFLLLIFNNLYKFLLPILYHDTLIRFINIIILYIYSFIFIALLFTLSEIFSNNFLAVIYGVLVALLFTLK